MPACMFNSSRVAQGQSHLCLPPSSQEDKLLLTSAGDTSGYMRAFKDARMLEAGRTVSLSRYSPPPPLHITSQILSSSWEASWSATRRDNRSQLKVNLSG